MTLGGLMLVVRTPWVRGNVGLAELWQIQWLKLKIALCNKKETYHEFVNKLKGTVVEIVEIKILDEVKHKITGSGCRRLTPERFNELVEDKDEGWQIRWDGRRFMASDAPWRNSDKWEGLDAITETRQWISDFADKLFASAVA